jgi:hypothetical protein
LFFQILVLQKEFERSSTAQNALKGLSAEQLSGSDILKVFKISGVSELPPLKEFNVLSILSFNF